VELDEELEDILRDLGEGLLSCDLLLKSSRLVLGVDGSSREVGERFLACRINEEKHEMESAKSVEA